MLPLTLLALGAASTPPPAPQDVTRHEVRATDVAEHYVTLARARYQDSMEAALELLLASKALIDAPGEDTLAAAKAAWIEAHSVYSHAEVFRFGNPNVDAWEGAVNGWPMDEGLIDYVADGYVHHEGNPFARFNIIANGGAPITDELIAEFGSGADPKAAPESDMTDVESNVTTGFHAVEFLLWGQDLGTAPDECGARPHTDFVEGEGCTGGACARRRDYLSAATRLLVADLRKMVADWDPRYRLYATTYLELETEEQLDRAIVGLGSLSYAEVASERLQVALLTGDQEEEQSCFSDTSMIAIEHNLRGVEQTYLGRHVMRDGTVVEGASIADLVRAVDPELDARVRAELAASVEFARALAEGDEPLDTLILPGNDEGNARIRALMALLATQTESLEAVRELLPELAAVGVAR